MTDSASSRADLGARVVALGLQAGLAAVGIAPALPMQRARRAIESRKLAGLHAGMHFTYAEPERSTEPGRAVVGAASMVVGALRYVSAEPQLGPGQVHEPAQVNDPGQMHDRGDSHRPPVDRAVETVLDGGPLGRVARYAWSDYYGQLREALDPMAALLRSEGWATQVLVDDNALVDREAAYLAGVGWYGKNCNILVPGVGSWVVLGSVVTDAPLTAATPLEDGCGPCRRCIASCPTGALVGPGVLDARRCLAWLVQAKGVFPVEHRVALGDRIYGCDDCQESCPVNSRSSRIGATSAPHQRPPETVLSLQRATDTVVSLLGLLAASDNELLARHSRWYIPGRKARYLRRNALVALGNTADGHSPAVQDCLTSCLADRDPLVRAHAVWAAARLGRRDLIAEMTAEADPMVQTEIDRVSSVPVRHGRVISNGPGPSSIASQH